MGVVVVEFVEEVGFRHSDGCLGRSEERCLKRDVEVW